MDRLKATKLAALIERLIESKLPADVCRVTESHSANVLRAKNDLVAFLIQEEDHA